MTGETLILAGGSGFVGKSIVELLENDYQIVSVDHHIDRDFFADHPNVIVRELNLADSSSFQEILRDFEVTYVINLVSIVSAERDLSLFSRLIETNVRVLMSFYENLRNCPHLKLFVQFGSAEEYGSTAVVPFAEKNREYPDSPYSLIKQLATNTVLMLHRNYGFPVVVVRPGNLFGRHQPKDKLVPYIYETLFAGKELLLTPGEQKRDFIYVKDFVHALQKIMENPAMTIGSILNIASGKAITIRRLAEWMKERLKSTSVVKYGAKEYRKNEIMDFRCDLSELRNRTGFELTRNEFDGFEDYVREMSGVEK